MRVTAGPPAQAPRVSLTPMPSSRLPGAPVASLPTLVRLASALF